MGEDFSFTDAIGGPRGLVESTLPVVVFTVLIATGRGLRTAVVASVAVAVVALVVRIAGRQPLNPAISGLFGVAIGAAIALYTGQAVNFFLVGIARNALFAVGYALSAVFRWPLVGVFLGLVLGEQFHWRQVPARLRVYTLATWLWAGMFALRFAIQLPLYLQDRAGALGAVAVPLGLPLFGVVLGLTWLIVRGVPVAKPQEPVSDPPSPPAGSGLVAREPISREPINPSRDESAGS